MRLGYSLVTVISVTVNSMRSMKRWLTTTQKKIFTWA